jgi:hypothetical protein
MAWWRDTITRMVGLDPNRINPAMPAARQLLADIKTIEPDIRMLMDIFYNKIDPALKRMQPKLNDAMNEWNKIAPAADDVLALLGAGVTLPRIQKSLRLAPEQINMKWIQSALKSRGFDPGPLDGKLGLRTTAAIERYQAQRGLHVDGWPGPDTVQRLDNDLSVK